MSVDLSPAKNIITRHQGKQGALIPLLQEIQDHYGYVPRETVEEVGRGLGIPPVEVYGVLTFYTQFYLEPRGRHAIRVCQGTACHVMGGKDILDHIADRLGIADGQTTADGEYTLERVACLGCCGMAPVVAIDNDFHGRLTIGDLDALLEKYRGVQADTAEIKIMICMGTSGISAGAEDVRKAFERELIRHDMTHRCKIVRTGDRGLFRDVLVDIFMPELGRVTYENLTADAVPKIVEEHIINGEPVKRYRAGEDYNLFFEGQTRVLLANCGEIDPECIDDYLIRGGYDGLRKALTMDRKAVIDEVSKSGLRGRGGGGFPTGRKWEFCYVAEGDKKYVVCNADEGDPGAFMDRSLLEGDPHAVLEGMAIAAYAVGADEGYIYCRAEYPLAIERLRTAIAQAEERGLLGAGIAGGDFSFTLHIKEGAGAFVCGEETALIASIEGQRGMPRTRPPFPAQSGVWGKPTLINNVETFANVRHILVRGADWYAGMGTETSKGTKVFALAGKVRNTGLVEVPMGTTIRELVYGPGGGLTSRRLKIKGVQLGGPSGGCLPESLLDTPIDFESINATGAIMGSGGMVVMDERTCMVDIARFFLEFTVAESCGKCVPCRVGLKRMLEVLEEITQGRGKTEHLQFLQTMADTVASTSLCGLGATAPKPVLTTLQYFFDEYREHVLNHECRAHVCVALVNFVVDTDRCSKCGRCYKACPTDALEWQKKEYPKIDQGVCTKCKACITACDFMAIR